MRSHVELAIALDRDRPLARQLGEWLREEMGSGRLAAGERLPSTRALAATLGVSRTVVTEAYQQLYAEGWLDGRHGSGTYVAQVCDQGISRDLGTSPRNSLITRGVEEKEVVADLTPGRPWVADIDRAMWKRAWRRAAEHLPGDDPDPYGLPALRERLAAHLRRARGVLPGPDDILITRSTGHGLDLLAAALLRPGDRAGVEEPGWRTARAVLEARGAEVVPCPVDEDGVIVDRLPRDLSLLYTTPAHQFPLGGRLPVPRRQALVAWARATGAVIAEDDYDAEFRYDVAPLPALQAMAPDRVALLGTLSKSLTPDIGVGWMLGWPGLLARVAARRAELGDRVPGQPQEAVRVLIEAGDLDRHLRRMRREYARRREVLVEALREHRPRGDRAGLHLVVELPAPAVRHAIARARERGVLVDHLGRHHVAGPSRQAVHGLVIGYGSASLSRVKRGSALLAGVLRELRDPGDRQGLRDLR